MKDDHRTAVYLTDKEAEMFFLFQKHYEFFCMIDRLKVLEMRSGSFEINFDGDGKIAQVQTRVYQRYPQGNQNLHSTSHML